MEIIKEMESSESTNLKTLEFKLHAKWLIKKRKVKPEDNREDL